ncbi:unnamed protein product [Miscanthus lutarioriparius]|uniref:Uncharacterized protein n=1 Tax=Miscanthus lutarioriparius TaxID=422564 RepID=A0A811PWW2_9POAL|nr:unnamed protein product [Miscanthus lutarioriparius]
MLAPFSRLEATVPANDKRLALACLKLGQHLKESSSADPSRVLTLALRCLGILGATRQPQRLHPGLGLRLRLRL